MPERESEVQSMGWCPAGARFPSDLAEACSMLTWGDRTSDHRSGREPNCWNVCVPERSWPKKPNAFEMRVVSSGKSSAPY